MATSLVVHLDIVPENFEEFIEIVRNHGNYSVAAEVGCLDFKVMVSQDDENHVILVETYTDNTALQSHWDSEHMAAYREKTADMIRDRRRYQCDL